MEQISNLDKLTDFIFDFEYPKLNSEEYEFKAKIAFLDSMAVYVAGTSTDIAKKILKLTKNKTSLEKKSWINGQLYDMEYADAGLINGTIFHSLDLDDSGAFTQGHPSAVILPAVLTVHEDLKLTFKHLVQAYCIGVEIFSRISQAMPMLHLKGFHPTAVIGTLVNTAVVAKLFNADKVTIKNALTLACSMASGIIGNFGSDAKPLHVGLACKNGFLAYDLAKMGLTGNELILEEKPSFYSAFFGSKNHTHLSEQLNKLGNPFMFHTPGINIKFHASCSLTHRAIDSLIAIIEKHKLKYENIESIEVYSSPRAVEVLRFNNPNSINEAKFSIPFVLFLASKFLAVDFNLFTEKNLNAFKISGFYNKVKFDVHNDWKSGDDWRPDKVCLYTTSNKQYTEYQIQFPIGNANSPFEEQRLKKKMNACLTYLRNEKFDIDKYSYTTKVVKKTTLLSELINNFFMKTKNKIDDVYGTNTPFFSFINNGLRKISVNPYDDRVKKVLINKGICYYSKVPNFIYNIISKMPVKYFLDIGVNYGECLFSIPFHSETIVMGYEANVQLKKYLDKSITYNDDIQSLRISFSAVTNTYGEKLNLNVDNNWSGKSSLFSNGKTESNDSIEVKTTTIDSELKNIDKEALVLIKIDIQGAEPLAFEGAKSTNDSINNIIYIMEFDQDHLNMSGFDSKLFFSKLIEKFAVYKLTSRIIQPIRNFEELNKIYKGEENKPISENKHCDLVLLKLDDEKIKCDFDFFFTNVDFYEEWIEKFKN